MAKKYTLVMVTGASKFEALSRAMRLLLFVFACEHRLGAPDWEHEVSNNWKIALMAICTAEKLRFKDVESIIKQHDPARGKFTYSITGDAGEAIVTSLPEMYSLKIGDLPPMAWHYFPWMEAWEITEDD